MVFNTHRLICSAPILPPKESKNHRYLCAMPKVSRARAYVFVRSWDIRIGFPTQIAREGCFRYFRLSSKHKYKRSTACSRTLTATPGTALDSCNAVGIPIKDAALMTGQETYPPVPTTRSGRKARNNFFALPIEETINHAVLRLESDRERRIPWIST